MRITAVFSPVTFGGDLVVSRASAVDGWTSTDRLPHREGPFIQSLEDHEIELWFITEWGSKGSSNGATYRKVDYLEFRVSREEGEPIPTDTTQQGLYFSTLHPSYAEAAKVALLRLVSTCKYERHIPISNIYPFNGLGSATWSDPNGTEYHAASAIMQGVFRQQDPAWALSLDDPTRVGLLMTKDYDPRLHEEVFSDALCAWDQGHLRRAVIEAAISCEIATKHFFFAGESRTASAVFDHLESTRKLEVQVIDLVNKVCRDLFRRGFSCSHENESFQLRELFQARNKAVHRGKLEFRIKGSGDNATADAPKVRQWLRATELLIAWLDELPEPNQP